MISCGRTLLMSSVIATVTLSPATVYGADPSTPAETGTAHKQPASTTDSGDREGPPKVTIRCISRVGDNDEAIRSEVLTAASHAFEREGYLVAEGADTLVQVLVTRQDPETTDFEVQVGYSVAVGQPVLRHSSLTCPQCSAADLLTQIDRASVTLATDLRTPDEPAAAATEPEVKLDPPPQDPTVALNDTPASERPPGDGVGMFASGVTLTLLGGATLIGSSIAIGVEASNGNDIPIAAWPSLGASVAALAIGTPLWVAGHRRMHREHSPQLGFAPSRRGPMLVISGRF